jgi:Xaa-Pro aminopeptidase
MIVSMLDETAWLFNLRGNDIPYNPVFFSYAIVTPTDATLFVDDTKLSADVHSHLGDVKVKPYNAIFEEMTALKASFETATTDGKSGPKQKFLISTKASWALSEGLGGEENVDEVRSPIGDAKSIKNETELEGMRQCHIRDGAALTEYFAWLEDQLVNKGAKLDEVETSDKLEEIRS